MYHKFCKYSIIICLVLNILSAQDINDRIVLTVDGVPITQYDISKERKFLLKITHKNMTEKQVIDSLIMKTLITNEAKRIKVRIPKGKMNEQIAYIAKKNNMSLEQFKKALAKDGIDMKTYRANMKFQIEKNTVMRFITITKTDTIKNSDIENYYKTNIFKYSSSDKYDLILYASTNRQKLQEFLDSPILVSEKGIEKKNISVRAASLPEQTKAMFDSTQIGEYTPILFNKNSNFYQSFKMVKKYGGNTIPLSEAKESIKKILKRKNDNSVINEYFLKMRRDAKIKYL